MIGAGEPEHLESSHPLVAAVEVHERLLHGVAQGELPGYIGGRKNDAEFGALRRWIGYEEPGLLPAAIEFALNFLGVPSLVHLRRHTAYTLRSCRFTAP